MVGAANSQQYQGHNANSLSAANLAVFRDGLQKLGWVEGRNIRIDAKWVTGDAEPLKQSAKELVGLQPDLILQITRQLRRLCGFLALVIHREAIHSPAYKLGNGSVF